jgi:hypothetical protein
MREVKICAVHEQKNRRVMIFELLQKGIAATKTQRRKIPKPIRREADSFRARRISKRLSIGVAISVVGYFLNNDCFGSFKFDYAGRRKSRAN